MSPDRKAEGQTLSPWELGFYSESRGESPANSPEQSQWNDLLRSAFGETGNRADSEAHVLSFFPWFLPTLPLPQALGICMAQKVGVGKGEWRNELTARGKEAHLPQEEGSVHMAQGLLHIPEADERRHRTDLTTEKAEGLPHPRGAREGDVRGNNTRGIFCLSLCLRTFHYKVTQASRTIQQ